MTASGRRVDIMTRGGVMRGETTKGTREVRKIYRTTLLDLIGRIDELANDEHESLEMTRRVLERGRIRLLDPGVVEGHDGASWWRDPDDGVDDEET
jgi:hypothetical protein